MSEESALPGLRVEYRALGSLIPYARNSRTHSRLQIRQIADSIQRFGWTNPILVDGENGIIAGHGRLAAAKLLKMAMVPVIELSGLNEAQKRAYVIADNQLAIDSGWDKDILGAEVTALKNADFDMKLLGFADIDAIIASVGEPDPPKGNGSGRPSRQYNIIFEDDGQRKVWFDFTRKLKGDYPDIETLGARLLKFLTEGEHIGAR